MNSIDTIYPFHQYDRCHSLLISRGFDVDNSSMPKLWLALFFGYNGANFSGMQFQLEEHVSTVEDLLVEKMYAAGFLATNHHAQLEKQQRWSRAARTDKGVHAVINAVSALFTIGKQYFSEDHTLNRNQLHLDLKELFEGTEIVFHEFKRVTARFEVRHIVKSRHYCYICPKHLFLHPGPVESTKPEEPPKEDGDDPRIKPCEQDPKRRGQQKAEMARDVSTTGASDQKEGQKLLEKINSCCSEFVGSHNFHNYSKNLRAKDPQSQRYILRFWVEEHSKDYLIFHVIGQSFIYHQIRKMVGCIIMVFINQNPPTYIPNTFFRNQICMPLAPARGLYLRALSFDNYNKKKEIPEPLNIESQTVAPLEEAISRFITDQDDQEWTDWISQLRESIYHGIQCPQEEEPHPSKSRAIEQD